jgi:phage/plasmid-associated DNA primase
MNENRELMACENGVIDLKALTFRDGRPDDYITYSTGRHFRHYHPDDEEVRQFDENLRKVYPNPHRRQYFTDFFAQTLRGGNRGKKWLIATGPSDGAKSSMFRMLELAFGGGSIGYFGKFSREVFVQSTGKNSSSGPRPELTRIRGKRLMGVQEFNKDERPNIGFIKEMTGGVDSIWARGLYEKDANEINPQFTLIAQCNEAPDIPQHDEALWGRISILDHESKFVLPDKLKDFPVPEDPEEQFLVKRFHADPEFEDRMEDLADVLLWRLFERFKEMKMNNISLRKPKEVIISTDLYKDRNDIFLKFKEDRIEIEKNREEAKKCFLRHAEVFSEFNEWYKDEYPGYSKEKIGKSRLKNELIKRLGMIHEEGKDLYGYGKQARWWGYKFIIEEDEKDKKKSEPQDSGFIKSPRSPKKRSKNVKSPRK